jgi:hypothetical protein
VDVLLQLLDQVITTTQHQDVMRRNFPRWISSRNTS